jgi:L-serine deaminase
MSAQAIAEQYGYTKSSIATYLNKYGISRKALKSINNLESSKEAMAI